ncbi:MAG TPA: hypothetical protein VD969_12195 [Symbiobacteriaceae bacterium]|nr:hypothetical protein [Symbiobacteriaceae bacterium]
MCPRLARKGFFLEVLNEPAFFHKQRIESGDALTGEMYRLLTRLAENVREGTACTPAELQVLNLILDRCSMVKLKIVPGEDDPLYKAGSANLLRRHKVRAVIGEQHQDGAEGRRIYFEALVSLLEALEDGPLELCKCIECGAWFEPYSRAPVNKFCSTRCRNRHNYKLRKQEGGRADD